MARPQAMTIWIACTAIIMLTLSTSEAIGVNWGSMLSHPINPSIIVKMLKANGIDKVKLFDADSWTVNALAGSGIEVTVALPNDQLETMSSNYNNAKAWVHENVTQYVKNGVKIKSVGVGNEPFLTSYNGSFLGTTFPALQNIQKALNEAGLGESIKATIPLNADVYQSPDNKPSSGQWRADIQSLMPKIVKFLHDNNAPFMVNIYPFLSLYQNPDFPLEYAFFDHGGRSVDDGNVQYYNAFDANYDTLVWVLKKTGFPDMKIVVGEVGWPTDGAKIATINNAQRFYDGFLKKWSNNEGTPLRPGHIEAYLFGLIDENMKSIMPGNFERHWGIFTYDGKPKFPIDLTGRGNDRYLVQAKGIEYLTTQWCVFDNEADDEALKTLDGNMQYACVNADCTVLGYGSSCNNLDSRGNISYAFNIYYQMQDQDVRACDFNGLAKVTTVNASRDGCLFPVMIVSAGSELSTMFSTSIVMVLGVLMLLIL